MNKQVLFIQGAGKGAYKEDEKLVASLRQLLGPKYEVHYPAMQNDLSEVVEDIKSLER